MTLLDKAILILEEDQPLPLDIAAELMEEGIDVVTLEEMHRP